MDAEDAIEAAAFARLNVAEVTSQAKLFQHVPANTPPPVLIIGDMESETLGIKGEDSQRGTMVLAAVIAAEERRPIRALKAAVMTQLDGHQEVREGWQLSFTFAGADGFRDPETGEDYVGNFRFDWLALEAA